MEWYRSTTKKVFKELKSSEGGLSSTDAEARLEEYGANKLHELKPDSVATLFLRQFQSPLIYILLISTAIVFFLGEYVDGWVILFVLIANAALGLYQEGRAQNTFFALRKMTETSTTIIRDGVQRVLSSRDAVPGDVVVLREGDKIPADGRVFFSNNFQVDEAALTGESTPEHKKEAPMRKEDVPIADRVNMVYKGTFALSGTAKIVITTTGLKTEIGKIATQLVGIDTEVPLKKNVRQLSNVLSIVILLLSAAVFAIGVWAGNSTHEMFLIAVAIAVSVIPEGLPIAITLVLATGVYRMSKRNALVKRLQAVEALGQANVIAVDKTGTITKNELMIQEVYVGDQVFKISGTGFDVEGDVSIGEDKVEPANHPELLFAGKIASFCANATVSYLEEDERWLVNGDPTEAAMLVFGEKVGFKKSILESTEKYIREIPFDFGTKFHTTIHEVDKKNFMTVVGAPERVLDRCTSYWDQEGSHRLNEKALEKFRAQVKRMSSQGLRVLVFAFHENVPEGVSIEKMPPLTCVGVYGMRDVMREGVAESVARAKADGIRVVMITGDHKVTAQAIATMANIYEEGDEIMTGPELDTLGEKSLMEKLERVTVFARVTPEHKFKIIEGYKSRGEIVAMTGDGVNDALSLVDADLGVAMGKIGTEVTKEAADIILLDDNFSSIIAAIEEGRNIYNTIKKVLVYLFSTGLAELMVIIGALSLALPLPLLPSQIIWLNLVTDGFLVVALAMEPRERLERHVVRKRSRFMVDIKMLGRIVLMATVMTIGTLIIFNHYHAADIIKAWTMTMTVLAVYQWLNVWNSRSPDKSIFQMNPFSNIYLFLSFLAVIALQLVAIYTPFMQKILRTTALNLSEWGIIIVFSLAIILVEEIRKLIMRRLRV